MLKWVVWWPRLLALAAVASVGAQWATKNADALTDRPNDSYYQALHYVEENLDRSSSILVDDSYWNPLVDAGWSSDGWHGAIWYFKLDLDPVARESDLQNGWKDIDYILVNDVMVQNLDGLSKLPQLSDAYKHSHVLQQWGSGQNKVQLRKINERMVPFGSVGEAAKAKPGVPPVIAPRAGDRAGGTGQDPALVLQRSVDSGQGHHPRHLPDESTSSKCYWAKISDLVKETRARVSTARRDDSP